MTTLDVDFARSQFPAFAEPDLEGWAFFENAGGSYTCRQVIDRLTRFYTSTKVQPYYAYPTSQAAGAAMDEAYERLAGYLNVSPSEVHFGPSTSQNTYVLERALRAMWTEGDEVVVSNQDHEANAGAWRRLAETGIVVKEWRIDPATGQLDPGRLEELVSDRTRLVAFPHASNVVAAMNPVKEITGIARRAGAITVVDGVAAAPHGLPDVADLGADVYLFSTYKTWGPHLGLMVVRGDLIERVDNQGHFFNAPLSNKRLTPAGPDHAQIAAAAGIADYLDALYHHHSTEPATPAARGRFLHDLFLAREQPLLERLLARLRTDDAVTIIGPDDAASRAAAVSFIVADMEPPEVLERLVEHKIMAGVGNFYGWRPLEGMDVAPVPGVTRLSFVHYTSDAEMDQLIDALDRTLP